MFKSAFRFSFLRLLPLLALACALLAGCTQESAPQSSFLLLDGQRISTESLRGKVALVNFWATSCTTCVAEMPEIAATYGKFKAQGYETLAVAMQYDKPEYVSRFAAQRALIPCLLRLKQVVCLTHFPYLCIMYMVRRTASMRALPLVLHRMLPRYSLYRLKRGITYTWKLRKNSLVVSQR